LTSEEQSELALDDNSAVDDPLERIDKLTVLVLRAFRDAILNLRLSPLFRSAIPPSTVRGCQIRRSMNGRRAAARRGDERGALSDGGLLRSDAPARPDSHRTAHRHHAQEIDKNTASSSRHLCAPD
jgi:hypothetical protein